MRWTPTGNLYADVDFVNLEPFETSTAQARLLAVGSGGQVRECLIFESGGVSVQKLGNFDEYDNPDFACAWAKEIDDDLHVFLGTQNGKIWYSAEGRNPTAEWREFTNTGAGGSAVKQVFYRHVNTTNHRFIGLALSANLNLSRTHVSASGMSAQFADITLNPSAISGYVAMAPHPDFSANHRVPVVDS